MNDQARRNFVLALDNAPFEVSDSTAAFLEEALGAMEYSPQQRRRIAKLRHYYLPRLKAAGMRLCRGCGCHDLAACDTDAGPCHWVAPNLCSACAGSIQSKPETKGPSHETIGGKPAGLASRRP